MTKEIYHIVVSYDIRDDKRLARVGKAMKDYGQRVLLSVWECNLTADRFDLMKRRLESIIDHMEDSIRYYFLCSECIGRVQVSGKGEGFKQDERFALI